MTKSSHKIVGKKYKVLKVRHFYDNPARSLTMKDKLRILAWKYYIGEIKKSKCLCCEKKSIYCDHFEAGRIIAGGTYEVHNVLPICGLCNKKMARKNFIEFKNVRYPQLTNSSRWMDAMNKLNKFKSTIEDIRLKDDNLFDEDDY
jgi:hypothetical protein